MEIRHLRLIKEVAEKGSLTKAKESLYLSQSALSHQLKEAETHLGTPLFHRVNKKLILTGVGKILLGSAEKILSELDNARISVKKYINGDTGQIRLATQCYTCYHWLPTLMIDYNKVFPNVEIEIFPESTSDPVKHVLEGALDLAIVSDCKENTNIKSTKLFRDELRAIVPIDHPWTKKPFVTAKDFENEQVFVHSHQLDSSTLFRCVLVPAGVNPKKVTAIQVTETTMQMIRAGMGVNVIAQWVAETYLKDNNLTSVQVTENGLFRNWHAITLNKPEPPLYLENFIGHLIGNIGGVCKTTGEVRNSI